MPAFKLFTTSYFFLMGLMLMAVVVRADHTLPTAVEGALHDLETAAMRLDLSAAQIHDADRPYVINRIRSHVKQMNEIAQALAVSPGKPGWYAVDGADCYGFCDAKGLNVGISPEGAQCVSGENRAESAFGKVSFKYGCFGGCTPEKFSNAISYGPYCYKPGQKKDDDRTDITVGCFCRK